MPVDFHKQPWKGLYLLYQGITTPLIRVPWWILLATPPSNRGRRGWTISRVIHVKLIKHVYGVVRQRTGWFRSTPNHLAIGEGPGVKGVWVPPTPQLITGEVQKWAEKAKVESLRIPGYWLDKEGTERAIGETPRPGEKVLYALHGGAYAAQSAHPKDPISNIPLGVLEHVPSVLRSFTLEYRLSTVDSNPFPAALLDAIAGYSYLVNDIGFSPSDIILEGDSAGGNLALALTRYLVENQDAEFPAGVKLPPPPGRLILNSPWSDIGDSDVVEGSSVYTNLSADYVGGSPATQVKLNFLGPLGWEAANSNRYISPASQSPSMGEISFQGFPPTFISSGGAEVLLDQIRSLKKRMVGDLGDRNVEYVEAPEAVHDFLVFPWHEPERTETLRRLASWIEAESGGAGEP